MNSQKSHSVFKLGAFALTAGVMASLSGCEFIGNLTGAGEQKAAAAQQAHRMPQVGVLEAQPTDVPSSLSFTGRAVAYTLSDIRPQVDGIIEKRLFEEGAYVNEGDVLYQLDDETYKALYANAQAAIKKSEALLTNAEIKVKRNERLVKINAVSEQVLDDALANLREAKANLEANKAALKTAKINLDRTKIKAPVSGLIGRSEYTKGALVSANQANVLATIQQLDPIFVDFSVPSYYAIILKKQLRENPEKGIDQFPVSIHFEDGSDYDQIGRIKLSEFKVDPSTDSIILRTEFANPDRHLLPGMFIRGSVMTGYRKNVYLVPSLALSRDALGHPYLMVLAKDGTVTVRPVKDDGLYQQSWVITEGLQPGDQIITKGLQFIRPGMKAAVMGAQPQKPTNATEGK